MANLSVSGRATASGRRPTAADGGLGRPASRGPPCRPRPPSPSGAAPLGELEASPPATSSTVAQVDRLHAVRGAPGRAARAPGPRRSPGRRRGAARSGRRAGRPGRGRRRPACRPSGTSAYSHRLPGGRQDVGEVEEPLVGRPVGHLDRAELRLRHAQVLGLAARHRAVERRVAEQRRRPCPARGPGWSRTGRTGRARTSSRSRTRC